MAEYALIDGYLDSLRTSVRWRRDVDDLVAEMEDHLYSTVERVEARGKDRLLAQRQTLEQFGDPDVLASAFASTPTGGIAVPTQFTKSAGVFALLSAVAWLVALVGFQIASLLPDSVGTDPDQFVLNGQTAAFILASLALISGGALMVVAMIGLQQRHGGLGVLGIIGLGITGLGVAASVVAWAFGLWVTLLGIGTLLFAIAVLRRDVAPRLWTAIWGAGFAIGAVTWNVLRWFEVGSIDGWGNYPSADIAAPIVGIVITVVGLIGLGRWMWGEDPVDVAKPEPLQTA